MEILQEGWVKFMRIPMSDGYLDRWMGDSADNPNRATRSQQNVNSIVEYVRKNGTGPWKSKRNHFRNQTFEEIYNNYEKEQ